jgi:3',5'-cyclic-AMP phosphodiesterase
MTQNELTRRDALKITGLATLGIAAHPAAGLAASQAASPAAPRQRALRLAHLTDIHVQPERRASDGMIACLHHVQSLKDKPDLILTGGDSIFDSFESDDARTKLQWDLWHAALKNENGIAVKSCIGNHDIWGINKARSKTTGEEPNYGKKRAIDMLHLTDRYYAFDQAGWHFIVLDSTQPDDAGGYTAFLDEAQLDWLQRDLRDTLATTPVLMLSHIPIVSVTPILWAKEAQGDLRIKSSHMHIDCVRLKTLFAQHPNVKLCLSGHMHLIDRVDYNGVTYICDGAVSGNWWKGRHKDCDEGYGVVDLYTDGTIQHKYVKYGWQAQV